MTFASDAHRKWWYANHGTSSGGGGGVGGSGVSFPDVDPDVAMQAAQDLEDAKHYADNPAARLRRDIKEDEKTQEYLSMTGGG